MPRRACALALPLGILLAVALGACGSGDADRSGATLTPPPAAATTAPASTVASATTTGTTATTTPAATTTAPSTTPTTSTQATGGATTTQPTTGFAGGARGAPAGCAPAVGGFIRDVRASDCAVAREVATAWFAAVHAGAAPDGPIDAAGYSCSGTLVGERASVTCSGARDRVAFTASP
jgi:hypothetical protein